MIICPNCKEETLVEAIYCCRCGTQLRPIQPHYLPSTTNQPPLPPQSIPMGYYPYLPQARMIYGEDPNQKGALAASVISIVASMLCFFIPLILCFPLLIFAILVAIYGLVKKTSCLPVIALLLALGMFGITSLAWDEIWA